MNEQDRFHAEVMQELEWHEHNRRILDEIGITTDGIVAEGKEHKERMAQLGISKGFEDIFIGDRNG